MIKKTGSLSRAFIASVRNRKQRPVAPDIHEPAQAAGLLIASYNVHKCVGTDRRFDPERTGRVIHEIDADVIALQEADTRFGERRGLLDLVHLERETGLIPVPLAGVARAHGWHGNVLLVREGLVRDVHQVRLPGLEPRGALVADVEMKQGGPLRIIAAHLGLLHRSRAQQAGVIVELLKARDEIPTVLLGDLNEWRIGDRSSLKTFHGVFGPLPPAVPSFPAGLPVFALDRIMVNRPEMLGPVRVHDTTLARRASDHLPIKARITAPKGV